MNALLNKDFNSRPSIFQIANFPAVKSHILAFINENNIKHEVDEIIDWITNERSISSEEDEEAKDHKENERSQELRLGLELEQLIYYSIESFEEWAFEM